MQIMKRIADITLRCLCSSTLLVTLGILGANTHAQEIQRECQQVDMTKISPPQKGQPESWPFFEEKYALNSKCWVSFEDTIFSDQKVVLVDVRNVKEVQEHPLHDVLAMPLHAIQDDIGLRDKKVVLVGTGFDQVSLNQACIQLRQSGADAVALSGGARALVNTPWGENSGISFAQITPEEFLMGSRTIPWELMTMGLDGEQVVHLPQKPLAQEASENAGLFNNQLNHHIEYVLIAPDEKSTRALQQSIGKSGISNTVWLKGGIQAYEEYIEEQYRIRIHAEQPLIRPCGSL